MDLENFPPGGGGGGSNGFLAILTCEIDNFDFQGKSSPLFGYGMFRT